jgi:hypothetical protein
MIKINIEKYGLDADYNFLENFKFYNKNMNITQHTNHTNFLAEIQLLFDNFENKLNASNSISFVIKLKSMKF